MRWVVVINPHAGVSPTDPRSIEREVASHGLDAEVVTTESPEDLDRILEQSPPGQDYGVGVVGGDGSLHTVVNVVMKHHRTARPLLALLPGGSGSDFGRTFGFDDDLGRSMQRLASPTRYTIDIGRMSGTFGTRYFLNAANSGIAAASVALAERWPRRLGSARYTSAFWAALARFPEAELDVHIDRHRFEGRAINVVVANGQFFGGGLNVAPRSTLVDGVMDVQVFSGPKRNAFAIMPRLAFGSHLTHRAVRRYIGANVSIQAPDEWPVEADGEIIGRGSVEIETIPQALDFAI